MPGPLPIVRLPANAVIFKLGSASSAPRSTALLRFPNNAWTIDKSSKDGQRSQAWAIVGDAEGRRLAVETLLSRHKIHPIPPPPGPFPLISELQATSTLSQQATENGLPSTSRPIRHLAFARPPTSGEFTDYTARYGALQESDKLTFQQTLSSLHPEPSPEDIEHVAKIMNISHLLDLPAVSLSSGQTRRGRIAAALLTKPILLLLEDPMAGLDVKSRGQVSEILRQVNEKGDTKIVLVLRNKSSEDVPDWVTDICEVTKGDVWLGSRKEWEKRKDTTESGARIEEVSPMSGLSDTAAPKGEPIVALNGVSVSYGEGSRPVLKDISWTIRPGDHWHLQGANGSGKTTLLSLILGHHPRSYSLPASTLELFSKPRRATPTAILRKNIGHTSPEIYASYPRGMGLTAMETVGTGYEGIFSRRQLTSDQKNRIRDLLLYFGDLLQTAKLSGRSASGSNDGGVEAVGNTLFAHFHPPQQALLLFLRSIVSKAPLVILDEPSQGMDEVIWARCRQLLEKEWKENPTQAVIVVSHYDDEVPWAKGQGRVMRLEDGHAEIS